MCYDGKIVVFQKSSLESKKERERYATIFVVVVDEFNLLSCLHRHVTVFVTVTVENKNDK